MSDFKIITDDDVYKRPLRGKNTVPAGLTTSSSWRKAGYRVRPGAVPRGFARVGIAWGGKTQICRLFAIDDCVPINQFHERNWRERVLAEIDEEILRVMSSRTTGN